VKHSIPKRPLTSTTKCVALALVILLGFSLGSIFPVSASKAVSVDFHPAPVFGERSADANIHVKQLSEQVDEEWTRACRELEPRYQEFLALPPLSELQEAPGVFMIVEKPFVIRNTKIESLPLQLTIKHVDNSEGHNDILFVKKVTVNYCEEQWEFSVDRELEPVGREIEELERVKATLNENAGHAELERLWIEPYWQESVPFVVSVTASDALSGLASVELYYRSSTDNINWGEWRLFGVDNTAPYSWSFDKPDGYALYEFYSVAKDIAGNVESVPDVADAACGVVIPATVDIDPDTLNLRSQGRWITAYIELPSDYSLTSVDVSSIRLQGVVRAESQPTEIGDHNRNGVPDLMVKFNRSAVQAMLSPGEARITVTGNWNKVMFKGSDTIRVIR